MSNANKTIVFLHGYGGSSVDFAPSFDSWRTQFADCQFLFLNGPLTCSLRPGRFQWIALSTNRSRILTELRFRGPAIENQVNRSLDSINGSIEDSVLVGFSQGAMIALYLALVGTKKPKGLVLFSCEVVGLEDYQPDQSNQVPRILFLHGRNDSWIPASGLRNSVEAVKRQTNFDVHLHILGDGNHEICESSVRFANSFIQQIWPNSCS